MIGMPGADRPGAIKLFSKQNPNQPVRQCEAGKRPAQIRALQTGFGKAVRATDQENEVASCGLPIIQFLAQLQAGELGPAFIQRDHEFRSADFSKYLLALGLDRGRRILMFAAAAASQCLQTKLPLAWQPLYIFAECFVDPARLTSTDGN